MDHLRCTFCAVACVGVTVSAPAAVDQPPTVRAAAAAEAATIPARVRRTIDLRLLQGKFILRSRNFFDPDANEVITRSTSDPWLDQHELQGRFKTFEGAFKMIMME